MNNYLLKSENIHKTYPSGHERLHVLKGVDLEVEKGQMIVIIGPSGAGKSTLLHILGGLDRPSEGQVFIENTNLYKINDSKRAAIRNKRIGFVFQFYHLLPEFTAMENVMLPAMIDRQKRTKKELLSKAASLLDEMGLSGRIKHRPSELSGGEQQRVAIARALMNDPELVLCDEPTGNLDKENSNNLIGILQRLNSKKRQTFLIVSHDDSIAEIGDKRIEIEDGKFIK